MKTAEISWAEIRESEGDSVINVFGKEGSLLHGRAETLGRILDGCELLRLAKGVYQVTKWPEEKP